jgi:dTDP-glucose 4,6-dehydratase
MVSFGGTHAVVLGGAGFLGSHLAQRLAKEGARVTVIDNLITGAEENVSSLFGTDQFTFVNYDVTNYLHVLGEVDFVVHFASPASPVDYLRWPIQTLKVGSLGTHKALGLAKAKRARFLLASTSEVYGDPLVNPQPEGYWGNVNPTGPRGVYDEAKRFAEALTLAYHREHGLPVRIARIFNAYGPRMRIDDGRAVPAFFVAALRGVPLPVHGDGTQTRSLCYVDDLIEGILRLMTGEIIGPVNLGMPHAVSMLELAEIIQDVVGAHPGLVFGPRPEDDPGVRCPDIRLASTELGWSPSVTLRDGLDRTLPWFRRMIEKRQPPGT